MQLYWNIFKLSTISELTRISSGQGLMIEFVWIGKYCTNSEDDHKMRLIILDITFMNIGVYKIFVRRKFQIWKGSWNCRIELLIASASTVPQICHWPLYTELRTQVNGRWMEFVQTEAKVKTYLKYNYAQMYSRDRLYCCSPGWAIVNYVRPNKIIFKLLLLLSIFTIILYIIKPM